ncbi:hypothetical protein MSTE_00418 [Mycobacteroides stephanolepidis]|uniref:Uncharacterized protein n=1 Tax=[Mycobacterium] stephanolepidis TaxID=1520670 RepID=A0A1Z4ES35_9MYCO|nr:hypothetical protein MSTE_00418 [[Mycobacterium] stephanolepidis]
MVELHFDTGPASGRPVNEGRSPNFVALCGALPDTWIMSLST